MMAEDLNALRACIRDIEEKARANFGPRIATPSRGGDLVPVLEVGIPQNESAIALKNKVPCLSAQADVEGADVLNPGLRGRLENITDQEGKLVIAYDPYSERKPSIPTKQKGKATVVALHALWLQIGTGPNSLCYGCPVNCFGIPKHLKSAPADINPVVPLPTGEANGNPQDKLAPIYSRTNPDPRLLELRKKQEEGRYADRTLNGAGSVFNPQPVVPNTNQAGNEHKTNGVRPLQANGNSNGRAVYLDERGEKRLQSPSENLATTMGSNYSLFHQATSLLGMYALWGMQDLATSIGHLVTRVEEDITQKPFINEARRAERIKKGVISPGAILIQGIIKACSSLGINMDGIENTATAISPRTLQGTPLTRISPDYVTIAEKVTKSEIAGYRGGKEVVIEGGRSRKITLLIAMVMHRFEQAVRSGSDLDINLSQLTQQGFGPEELQKYGMQPSQAWIKGFIREGNIQCMQEYKEITVVDGHKVVERHVIPNGDFEVSLDLTEEIKAKLKEAGESAGIDPNALFLTLQAERLIRHGLKEFYLQSQKDLNPDAYKFFYEWLEAKRQIGVVDIREYVNGENKAMIGEMGARLIAIDEMMEEIGDNFGEYFLGKIPDGQSYEPMFVRTKIDEALTNPSQNDAVYAAAWRAINKFCRSYSNPSVSPVNYLDSAFLSAIHDDLNVIFANKKEVLKYIAALQATEVCFKDGPINAGLEWFIYLVNVLKLDSTKIENFLAACDGCGVQLCPIRNGAVVREVNSVSQPLILEA